MTKGADKGIYSDEVILYDENGDIYKDDNPLPVTTISSVLSPVLALILAALVAVNSVLGFILADLQLKADLDETQPVVIQGFISEDNSSSTPLPADTGGADHIFTGVAVVILDPGIVYINVSTDVASATDGLEIQQSSDCTNWDHDDVYTVPAGGNKNYSINPFAQCLRVVYTNGVIEQTHFRLQTIYKANSLASSHRIQDPIVDDDDSRLVKAVLSAKFDEDGFGNIGATSSGNLRVTDAENGLAIAKGDVQNTTFIHKFGNAPDFDAADLSVTIWDGADDGVAWEAMTYTYSSTADIDTCSSSNAGDTQDIEIQGLDASYDLTVQTITLSGQAQVNIPVSLIRVFRLKNVNSSDLAGHVFCFVNTPDTTPADGIPDDPTKNRAIIQLGNNQTLMAVFTIPAGQTGYMRDWYAVTAGANRASNYVIDLYARPFGQVFQLKHKSALADVGTSYIQHFFTEPEIFSEKTDIEMQASMTSAGGTEASISAGFDIVLVDN